MNHMNEEEENELTLSSMYPRGYVGIDLDAMEDNINRMKDNISDNAKMMLIIKADGYGHGAIRIAQEFEVLKSLWGFGVATLEEAIELREARIQKPILVLGCVFPNQYAEAIRHQIRINVFNSNMAHEIGRCALALNETAYIHIKLDTGMSRLGFICNAQSFKDIEKINNLNGINIEGIFTHFAKADETSKISVNNQFELFNNSVQKLEEKGVSITYKHCSNSAGIIDHPEFNMDIVRAGISLYGLYPSEEVDKDAVDLTPVLSFHSCITSIKEIVKGTEISYGGVFVATKDMTIAVIPIGYADGYPRTLSNKGWVLINGRKAPILGRICMDQMMIDVTGITDVTFQTPVVLIGSSLDESISVEALGGISGKFNYEFVCGISKRIPRIYKYKNKWTK